MPGDVNAYLVANEARDPCASRDEPLKASAMSRLALFAALLPSETSCRKDAIDILREMFTSPIVVPMIASIQKKIRERRSWPDHAPHGYSRCPAVLNLRYAGDHCQKPTHGMNPFKGKARDRV